MNTRVLLLGCLLALAVQAQETKRELWTWKDANGVTQYSDRPVPGACEVHGERRAPRARAEHGDGRLRPVILRGRHAGIRLS